MEIRLYFSSSNTLFGLVTGLEWGIQLGTVLGVSRGRYGSRVKDMDGNMGLELRTGLGIGLEIKLGILIGFCAWVSNSLIDIVGTRLS